MKTLNAVKSKAIAIGILNAWITENQVAYLLNTDSCIEPTETRCACGQTPGMSAWFEGSDKMVVVAICENCNE